MSLLAVDFDGGINEDLGNKKGGGGGNLGRTVRTRRSIIAGLNVATSRRNREN